MPTARSSLAAVVGTDGRIYAIGGYDGNHALDTLEAYTPSTNTWETLASMPTARYSLAAAVGADGRIFAIGGTGYSNNQLVRGTVVEAYTPSTNTWETVASMPTGRFKLAAASGMDSRIYAFGGTTIADGEVATVEAYSPTTNAWVSVASMPTIRRDLAGVTGADGRIFAIGGYHGQNLSSVEAFSPKTSTWASVAGMPTARGGLAAARGVDGSIYAIGGSGADRLKTVEVYKPTTNTWTSVASMPTARDQLAAVAADGRIFALGGDVGVFTGSGYEIDPVATVEAYTP
jgi:N-acetylneuraminic acid mutarotase